MVSTENRRVRQLLEDFVAALTPTDHEPTLEELRGSCDQWMTTNVPAPPELIIEQVNAGGVSCLWAWMPGTSAERTILYLHGGAYVVGSAIGYPGSPRHCLAPLTPECCWSTSGSPRRTRTRRRLTTP